MDNYEPTLVVYANNQFSETMDYVYQVSHPVQQRMMKVWGCLIADA